MSDSKEQGIKARNQEFSRFEQVSKDQSYQLSEQPGSEEFDDDYQIETCDMSAFLAGEDGADEVFSQQLGKALESIGFAILTGHGVDPDLHARASDLTLKLFDETSETDRLEYLAKRSGSVNQGYFPMRETTIIHPDLVQGWVFCRRAFNLDGNPDFNAREFWPAEEFEAGFRGLIQAQEELVLPIMQSLLRYLGNDPHSFDHKLQATNFGFRLNHYPPLETTDNHAGGRMLGHEDVDLFTFLPAPATEGLQVLNRSNMRWIRLEAPPGSIILNTGDYMQRISNDIFPSTTHRVARPRQVASSDQPRISLPMAVYLWEDEILEVLPGTGEPNYPPVTALEFHTAITSKYYGEGYAVSDDNVD